MFKYMRVLATVIALILVASVARPETRALENSLVLHLNRDALSRSGLRVAVVDFARPIGTENTNYGQVDYAFSLRPFGITVPKNTPQNLKGIQGYVAALGGVLFMAEQTPVDLRHVRLRVHDDDPTRWDLVDEHDVTWLILDHAHPSWDAAQSRASVLHANVRVSTALANKIAHAEMTGNVIGGADFAFDMNSAPILPVAVPAACQAPWPSEENPASIQLTPGSSSGSDSSPDTIAFERCLAHNEDGQLLSCSQEVTNGRAVFAPDASLKNVGKSSIPWYGMFTGAFPPYQNDQHPFLIWNLYRIDPDGTFKQLGRSGVKHAFYAVNTNCPCPGGHVVYPQCEDVYSSYSNDSLEFVGPRSEVLPAQGVWGRCGSVFDSDCDGKLGPRRGGEDDGLLWRLSAPETELLPSRHPGATYIFEYGYYVRDSARHTAMGFRIVHPERSIGAANQVVWQLNPEALIHGVALDAWVKPHASEADSMRSDFSTRDGSGSVAVRVIKLGARHFRYLYAVLNLDLAHAQVSGSSLNPKVTDSQGISRIEIPRNHGSYIKNVHVIGSYSEDAHHWKTDVTKDAVSLQADDADQLTWGTVYSVSFDSDVGPGKTSIRLYAGGVPNMPIETLSLAPTAGN